MSPFEPDTIHNRLAALSVCAYFFATCLCPNAVLAAPSSAESDDQDAEAIFRRGQAKYETADFNGAIELWTEAYALLDSTPENASIKALLIYNLAQAHAKAYEMDEDLIHLKQAKQLLTSFRNNLELLYEDQAALDEEIARVDERLAQLEAQLSAAEASVEREPPPKPAEPPPPKLEQPSEQAQPLPVKPGKPLIAAGAGLLGLGVAGGAVAIVGGVMGDNANDITELGDDPEARAEQFARGRTGNTLLLVGAISAGVLIPTGAALLAVGAVREKKRRAQGDAAASLRVSPNFAGSWGQGAGLTLSGRF